MIALPSLQNGRSLPFADIPDLSEADFRVAVLERIAQSRRISSLFAMPRGEGLSLIAVLTDDRQGLIEVCRARVGDTYAALTPDAPQAHWFEREIAEQWGVVPQGHPWLKPIRFHASYRHGADAWGRADSQPIQPGVTDYFRVEGDEIHEVAVGPVHAGIIEPGHFRFQCHGENVLHLEIELGYQHRGIERALVGGPHKTTPHYMETAAGDTSIGHSTAYALVVEALAGFAPSPRAQAVRAVALELERLANHTGDLGALANDIGFLPTASYCGRLRGDFLNMTALLCGNRFGRNLVRPGGARCDLAAYTAAELLARLSATGDDVKNAVELLWQTPSVMSRFEGTGAVSRRDAVLLGLVGPATRASGINVDIRSDLPWGAYKAHHLPSVTLQAGDVNARACVRWFEIQHSLKFIGEQVGALPFGPLVGDVGPLAPESLAVSLVEGWRGEICHVAVTDAQGRLRHYKIADPSFHNWFGLAIAMRDQQISDFPLCNKSFNLSYCGHDL